MERWDAYVGMESSIVELLVSDMENETQLHIKKSLLPLGSVVNLGLRVQVHLV